MNNNITVKWYNEQSYIILDDEFLQYDPPVRGIYGIFLGKDGPEICVYVGKSENVYRRMFKDDGHLVRTLQVCLDSGAKKVLLPITAAVDLSTVPSELIGCFNIIFYKDPEDAVFKALGVE